MGAECAFRDAHLVNTPRSKWCSLVQEVAGYARMLRRETQPSRRKPMFLKKLEARMPSARLVGVLQRPVRLVWGVAPLLAALVPVRGIRPPSRALHYRGGVFPRSGRVWAGRARARPTGPKLTGSVSFSCTGAVTNGPVNRSILLGPAPVCCQRQPDRGNGHLAKIRAQVFRMRPNRVLTLAG